MIYAKQGLYSWELALMHAVIIDANVKTLRKQLSIYTIRKNATQVKMFININFDQIKIFKVFHLI